MGKCTVWENLRRFRPNLPFCNYRINNKWKVTVGENIDLTKVIYGTELLFNTIPDNGYELTELKANGIDITSTKAIVIKEYYYNCKI